MSSNLIEVRREGVHRAMCTFEFIEASISLYESRENPFFWKSKKKNL